MKKKAPAKRVTGKEKTEKIIRKMKADLASSPTSDRKRKEVKKSPSQKKASQKKASLQVPAKKRTVRKQEATAKTQKKTIKRVSPKKEQPPVKKVTGRKKAEPVSKKPKTVATGKIGAELSGKDKAVRKEKPKKLSIRAGAEKKASLRASKIRKPVPKPVVKPGKKLKVAGGAKKAEVKKKTEKRKQQAGVKKRKMTLPGEIKKEKVLGIFMPEVSEKEKREGKNAGIRRAQGLKEEGIPKIPEAKAAGKKEKAYPAGEDILPPAPLERLPSEYGENSIALITVNPYRIFAFWEVREDSLKIFQGTLVIRLYDITAIDFDSMDANSYVDREVSERIGNMYLDVSPARDYAADIGILFQGGIFITIARSHKISTPSLAPDSSCRLEAPLLPTLEEGKSAEEKIEAGIRVGY